MSPSIVGRRATAIVSEDAWPMMQSVWGETGAVFDGTLFNRRDLWHRLGLAPGTDADLVLRAYERWGEDCVSEIRGRFALVIWDATRDLLLAARDPLGVYPLFHAGAGRERLVSPSIGLLVEQPGVSGDVNRPWLVDLLSHRLRYHAEDTCFRAINRVPPGHRLRVEKGRIDVRRYWDPVPRPDEVDWLSETDLDRFDEQLDKAVERCMDGNRSAIYLSGGFDSVSVAAVAADKARAAGNAAPLALSLVFPDPDCDESITQRRVARGLGLEQVLMPFNQALGSYGLLSAGLDLNARWPTPMLNAWRPAYQTLSAEARRHGCRVVLTGNGGDEWLTVSPFYAADLVKLLDVPALWRLLSTAFRSYRLPWPAQLGSLLWRFGLRPLIGLHVARLLARRAPAILRAHRRRDLTALTPSWIAPDPALRREADRRVDDSVRRMEDLPPPRGPFGFYFRDMPGQFLHPLTSMEMEEGFESGIRTGVAERHPYWDAELIELLCRIPPALLDRGGRTKGLVRRTIATRFPGVGFERHRKVSAHGFFHTSLTREGPSAWQRLGGAKALGSLGIVERDGLESAMTRSFAADRLSNSQRIWDVLSLEAWLQPRVFGHS